MSRFPRVYWDAVVIPLGARGVAIIDLADIGLAGEVKWQSHPNGYATRGERGLRPGRSNTRLHLRVAERMGILLHGLEIDHIDGDKLNNRRSNLRAVTPTQNMYNFAGPRSNNTSGVAGVRWHRRDKRWLVTIGGQRSRKHIGSFARFEDAVAARIAVMTAMAGEYAARQIASATELIGRQAEGGSL